MDHCEGHQIYDHLIEPPLEKAGWHVDTLSWRSKTNWSDYQLVMIRSPWDYVQAVDQFLAVLHTIESSGAHLANPSHIVRWNIDKSYLRELATRGVLTIPTLWRDEIDGQQIESFFELLQSQEIIVKPCISASARGTYRLTPGKARTLADELAIFFHQRPLMVQPFVTQVLQEGEFSLIYFDHEHSHTILKTPKPGDFRVQEEWGGQIKRVQPDPALIRAATQVMDAINQSLLYARLDFVRTSDGFALIEAELIEPSLYFNLDQGSPQRFADAVERRMRRHGLIN